MDGYVADHFPARPYLIGGLNALRLVFGISGSERVIVGRDGWLFYDDGGHFASARNDPAMTTAEARAWLVSLAGRTEVLQQQNISYLVVVAPLKETLVPNEGPTWFQGPDPKRRAVRLSADADVSQAGNVLYLHDALVDPTRWGLKTFSRHDTHWTGLGAYQAYGAIMAWLQKLGFSEPARPLSAFHEVQPEKYDPRDLALMLGVASFVKVDFPQFDDPVTERSLKTTYLSPNHSWTGPRVIDTGEVGKPTVLITMDSFSNALLPLLYKHFSRLIIAHNQDGTWRTDLIARYHPNLVIQEVVESGLKFAMNGGGPAPSALAIARIDGVESHDPDPGLGQGGAHGLWLVGGAGNDTLNGHQGPDTLDGMGGDDVIRGGRGGDLLHGGPGNDWLSGDRGDDTLWGGNGADVFHSFGAAGVDRVMDFSVAEGDRVEVDTSSVFTVRQVDGDTVVEIVGGARVILVGVQAGSLKPNNIYVRG